MPRGDGTGPINGRGIGNCIKYGLPLIGGIAACFGFRRGRGFGQQLSSSDELPVLKSQANTLEDSLNKVNKRISELEQNKQKET